jgi:DNA-binding CsgD family transcriptional regulator
VVSTSAERVLALADRFQSAALQGEGWDQALEELALATGSRFGQLVGFGSQAAVPFNLISEDNDAVAPAFEQAGGGDPCINPRVAAGFRAAVLQVLAEDDFISPQDYRRNPHYQEFAVPWDVPYICLTTLERQQDMVIGLSVLRSRHHGPISAEQRALFTAVAPHVRAAVRTQTALENQGARLLGRTFEGLSMMAFVCNRYGQIQVMTPEAEAQVGKGDILSLRHGRLGAAGQENARALADALDAVSGGIPVPGKPVRSTLVLRGPDITTPLVLELVRLPAVAHEFTFNPSVLIVARKQGGDRAERVASIARAAFGMTAAEAAVSAQVVCGQALDDIAQQRGATIGTVRAQVKAAMAKLGVSRQAELVGKLAQL